MTGIFSIYVNDPEGSRSGYLKPNSADRISITPDPKRAAPFGDRQHAEERIAKLGMKTAHVVELSESSLR